MKMFDLQAAMRGDPLITRSGESVKFVAYVPEASDGSRVIILSASRGIRVYFEGGNYYSCGSDEFDLFMAPKKKTVWVNFYGFVNGNGYTGHTHNTQADADAAVGSEDDRVGGKAYPVEIDD